MRSFAAYGGSIKWQYSSRSSKIAALANPPAIRNAKSFIDVTQEGAVLRLLLPLLASDLLIAS
jgi:hypothetical protein